MKKILSYIFILIILTGAFGLTSTVAATEPIGDCIKDGKTTQTTEADCTGSWLPPDSRYHLLSPLPCDLGDGCVNNKLVTFDPINAEGENSKLGEYLNIMIRIFIGICAVLAVMMIVVGGLEYMTSDLLSSKEQGRQRITGAIFGLILALGSWTLLNQINPDLLNTDLKSLKTAEVTVTLEEPIQSDSGTPPGATSKCQAGVVKTQISMFACSDIVNNINAMLTAAKNTGINITGGGYRSVEEQKQLRIKNCKGDYLDENAPCSPPTALPGFSNHNHGKAFDLRCDGVSIQTRDNKCFVWLKNNASKYGLANLASEPWHWSIDGK
ncbi:D-alanyl-D-alanine carboxypeptidase family protein [Candidatus Nomurabacteria bacterium]|nr:D-alanyl-D-alanine carboxypeptidase family protein [Candidatus Nomurabacteria bacterium]